MLLVEVEAVLVDEKKNNVAVGPLRPGQEAQPGIPAFPFQRLKQPGARDGQRGGKGNQADDQAADQAFMHHTI